MNIKKHNLKKEPSYRLTSLITNETDVFTSEELRNVYGVYNSTLREWAKKGYVQRDKKLLIEKVEETEWNK